MDVCTGITACWFMRDLRNGDDPRTEDNLMMNYVMTIDELLMKCIRRTSNDVLWDDEDLIMNYEVVRWRSDNIYWRTSEVWRPLVVAGYKDYERRS